MTKLRDDGYLETDDPVVAACFMECCVSARDHSEPCPLLAVGAYGQVELQIAGEQAGWYLTPILIPAAVVAEAVGYGAPPDMALTDEQAMVRAVLSQALNRNIRRLADWLKAHIAERGEQDRESGKEAPGK